MVWSQVAQLELLVEMRQVDCHRPRRRSGKNRDRSSCGSGAGEVVDHLVDGLAVVDFQTDRLRVDRLAIGVLALNLELRVDGALPPTKDCSPCMDRMWG